MYAGQLIGGKIRNLIIVQNVGIGGIVPQNAIDNGINSPGHFRTMIDPWCDCIGVGVTQYDGITYCYMFVEIPDEEVSHKADFFDKLSASGPWSGGVPGC